MQRLTPSGLLTFLKNWTLPISMIAGVLIYLAFANLSFLNPVKPAVHRLDVVLTPSLIFIQLLLTFCKVEVKQIRFKKWYLRLLLVQIIGSIGGYVLLRFVSETLAQAALVCFICPTATAAAVITAKLKGSSETIISYTILINIVAAIYVPTLFPLVYNQADLGFTTAMLLILSKVFPLLICPFILAQILRFVLPKVYNWLRQNSGMAFYIWALALAMVMGKTAKSIVDDSGHLTQIIWLSLVGLVACCSQFYLGKRIGGANGERISGGQALGQKNTVLAIWLAYTYLQPITSVAPGSYVLWQNIINSWQLWKQRKQS